jgi:HlyD family secretion protein
MKTIFKNKKFLITFIVLIGIFLYFFIFLKNKNLSSETKYVLSQIKRDNISVSVSSTGTVIPEEEMNLKAKASGEIVYLNMKNGQFVKKGELLLKINTKDQEKNIKDLENSLETIRLNLNKAKQTTLVDEKTLKNQAINSLNQVLSDWKSYLDNFENILKIDISSYHLNLNYLLDYYAQVVNFYFLNDINYQKVLWNNYNFLKSKYEIDNNLALHLNSDSSLEEVEKVLNDVVEDAKILNDTSRYSYQLLNQYYSILNDYNLTPLIQLRNISNDRTTLFNLFSNINSDLTSLLSVQKNIKSYKESLTDNIPYEIKELEITLSQKEEDLKTAKEKLNDYYLYAPFDGIITNLNVKKGDSVSSQTVVATLITKEKIIQVPFNEIDIVKIKLGQKAKITFDALGEQMFFGRVVEIDSTGTESQGVVSYNVKVALEEDNEDIKPSMSANVEIIIAEKENVLIVPNSAIKTINGKSYVQLVSEKNLNPLTIKKGVILKTPPKRIFITPGLKNDLYTEILDGLKEGDYVIVSTLSSKTTSTTIQRNLFMGGGFGQSSIRVR